ncbi:MarR family winged helix-turn-helix transcriptional regulator [Actinomadura sp. NEAU-AAG7]|uniref:MarR family winged helix-turn-helix transcriptional regulator n=1 Tax=Actinomadura sp. NEAU-AAG7 TaxID=2839640 RepID=UPI001BE41559|nr:MarR family transcriptional regulator [Actinomadura sp. NEAU-AAG7]MBT2212589.1 MarR family transcriptional regulator [Actinomadura sp. NEAU-AAG7]
MSDAVDAVMDAWRRERPDVDVWPVGVVGRVQRLARLLEAELQGFFRRYGLDISEADVLTTLRRSGEPYDLTPGQLVKASMVTSGAITKRIDRMVAKDLVERVPDAVDRRTVRIRLTPHGRQTIDDLFALHIANETRLLQALDRDQADGLADALRILLRSLGDTSLT